MMLRRTVALAARAQPTAARAFSAAAGDVKIEFATPYKLHSTSWARAFDGRERTNANAFNVCF